MKQRMMEVVVTAGLLELLGRAKLQLNHHHQQTNIQFFLQAGCPSCRPTSSVKALKGMLGHNTRDGKEPLPLGFGCVRVLPNVRVPFSLSSCNHRNVGFGSGSVLIFFVSSSVPFGSIWFRFYFILSNMLKLLIQNSYMVFL